MKIGFHHFYRNINEELQKEIILKGLCYNNDIYKEIKKILNKFLKIKGFNTISRIPLKSCKVLVDPLMKKELYKLDDIARLVLKGYFLHSVDLASIVSQKLEEEGYEVTEPDFKSNSLSFKNLKKKDILEIDDIVIFRPGGHKIDGVRDEEGTVIAALYGWTISTFGIEESQDDNNDLKTQEQKIEEQPILSQNENDIVQNQNNQENKTDQELKASEVADKEAQGNIDFKLKTEALFNEFLDASLEFAEIAKKLTEGIISESEFDPNRLKTLKEKFNVLKKEVDSDGDEGLNSIQKLKEKHQKREQENNLILESKEKALKVHKIFKTIYHINGISADFFDELNGLAEKQQKELTESTELIREEWFEKLVNGIDVFGCFIKAVRTSLKKDYDDDELDEILDKLEKEFELNEFKSFKQLSRQINRGNFAFESNDTPTPDKTRKKAEKTKKLSNGPISIIDDTSVYNEPIEEKPGSEITQPEKSAPKLEKKEAKTESVVEEDKVIQIKESPKKGVKERNEKGVEKPTESKHFEVSPDTKKTDIGDYNSEVLDENENTSLDNLSKEDINILKLLEANEPQLAFHLAKCYANKNKGLFLPPHVLENLFLSTKIISPESAIAEKVASNISEYELIDMSSNVENEKRLFYFASMLQPLLFAYNTTGAGARMSEMSFEKMPELSELTRSIYDYMSKYGVSIDLELVAIKNECSVDIKEKKAFIAGFKKWILKAQNNRFRSNQGHPHSLAWQSWTKEDGWIGKELLDLFMKEDIEGIKDFYENELKPNWSKQLHKDIKQFINGKRLDDQERANVWIETQVNELQDYLKKIFILFSNETLPKETYDPTDVFIFVKRLVKKLDEFLLKLENNNFKTTLSKVANQYVLKSISSLKKVLECKEPIIKVESLNTIRNYPLLFLDFYECDFNWDPKLYDLSLMEKIEKTIASPLNQKEESIRKHQEDFNIEAITKISQISNQLTEKIDISSLNPEAENRLTHEMQKGIMEVEKACALGYLNENDRLQIIAEIHEIVQTITLINDGINLPLAKFKIEKVLQKVEKGRIKQIKKAVPFIKADFKPEEKAKLKGLLEESKVLVFYETLELIKMNKFESDTQVDSHFLNFFNNVISQEDDKDAKEVVSALNNEKTLYNIDFKGLPFSQLAEAKRIGAAWYIIKQYSIKERVNLEINHLYTIIDGIGFKDAKIIDSQRKRNLQYYDFDCDPIMDKNRCPIPQFGSITNGKYRLICIWDGPPEEELIDDVKQYSPPTRTVIVFNFFKMTQQRRKDLAKVNRSYKSYSLVLDEFLLLYLCSIRGSRLPIFFKLTTPFTYVEPYQTTSSNLPQEMFYGRMQQIQQLKNAVGDVSCLIYGGRQLGKTVLQKEVQRLFHNPEIQHYSIYIDLRGRGIGRDREIEEITSVLIEELIVIPNLIPDNLRPRIGIAKFMQKLRPWFKDNPEGRIVLFLDESDKLLEKDAEVGWKHLLPLKNLMEDTQKRFKVIFSGLHDVRRTSDIPNNPLAHLGTPICIGPMIGGEETNEAQKLIELPLETLGFHFKSKDLVYLILSHANWYPSLIQIICSQLVTVMYSKRITRNFPQEIGVEEITEALNQCRDKKKENFGLTLALDPLYDLITNVIALETLNNPEIQVNGISLDDLVNLLIYFWRERFDSPNAKLEVHHFLWEMVDLGILREIKDKYFSLRTLSIIDLIGTKENIEDNVYIKKRELITDFKPRISRILFTKDHREQRSPFPASIFYMVTDPKIKVLVLKGSKMSGLDHIESFLKSRNKINLISTDTIATTTELEIFIDDIDKKRSKDKDENDVIFFSHQVPFETKQIEYIKNKIQRKDRLNAVFLMNPEIVKRVILKNDKSFERLENEGIRLINLPNWKESIIAEWFKETGCINADITSIIKATGYWHGLIDQFHGLIYQEPERWKELLEDFINDMTVNKERYILEFGIFSGELIKLIKELNYFKPTNRLDFIEIQEICDDVTANSFIDYLLSLNIIDNSLRVDHVIQKLIGDD